MGKISGFLEKCGRSKSKTIRLQFEVFQGFTLWISGHKSHSPWLGTARCEVLDSVHVVVTTTSATLNF